MASKIFRSKCIIYRAIEDTEKDTAFLHSLRSDTLGQYRCSSQLPTPITKESSAIFAAQARNKEFLAVIACLPPSSEGAEADGAGSEEELAEPIGFVFLHEIPPARVQHRTSNLGIYIAARYQGRGYGSEAIEWVLGWAFEISGLHRVGVTTFSHNIGPLKLYERLGFVVEGRRREDMWFDGGWHHSVELGMLDREWREKREKREKRGEGRGGRVE